MACVIHGDKNAGYDILFSLPEEPSMLNSYFRPLVPVQLPVPKNRQHYMHSFDLADPTVPEGFEDYLESVTNLCLNAGALQGEAHLTIDEKVVLAGASQRRPYPHVDGCFVKSMGSWTHPPTGPSWLHYCNNVGAGHVARMPVIVAASEIGCRAWEGKFNAQPASDGDLSHIVKQLDNGTIFHANFGYLLSPDCVHESMIMTKDTPRSFIRIALPPEFQV